MQRLAIGNKQQAYTLVELLVVIFIIGIVSGFILLRTGSVSFTRDLAHATRNLHNYIEISQTQAILQSVVLGMEISQQGYRVYEYVEIDGGRWQAMQGSSFWKQQQFPDTVILELFADYKSMLLPAAIEANRPQIIFLPSGEVTPFVISLYRQGDNEGYEIIGNLAGDIIVRELE